MKVGNTCCLTFVHVFTYISSYKCAYSYFVVMIDCGFGNLNGSLEQVQVELFEKQICGGSKVSIFQYSTVQFWCSNNEGMLLFN